MASDRFIYFGKKASDTPAKPEGFAETPSRKRVGKVIFEFIGHCPAISVELNGTVYFIEGQPGTPETFDTCPFRTERFIEIHCGKDNVDVITRQADPLVNALADGLQRWIARRLNGRAERAD